MAGKDQPKREPSSHPDETIKRRDAGSDDARIPRKPEDTTPSGDAKNDVGEDNQRQKDEDDDSIHG